MTKSRAKVGLGVILFNATEFLAGIIAATAQPSHTSLMKGARPRRRHDDLFLTPAGSQLSFRRVFVKYRHRLVYTNEFDIDQTVQATLGELTKLDVECATHVLVLHDRLAARVQLFAAIAARGHSRIW